MLAKTMALSLDNASLRVGDKWLIEPLSLTINHGERVALIGESGAGKSSLLSLLRQAHESQVAWCPQAPALVPMLSLYNNVYMGQLHQRPLWKNLVNLFKPAANDWQQVLKLASELGLTQPDNHRLTQSAERFSGGEQQRIGIARALFQKRPIFLGDEPVSAVDEKHAKQLLSQIALAHDTVVVALHDVELATQCCDRIIGLKQGKVVLDCPSTELSAQQLYSLYPSHQHRSDSPIFESVQ